MSHVEVLKLGKAKLGEKNRGLCCMGHTAMRFIFELAMMLHWNEICLWIFYDVTA